MSLDTLLRRIDRYLRVARNRLPRLRRLPYIVESPSSWPEGDASPGYQEWQRFERGELETADLTGYEAQNAAHLEVARAMRIAPKLYAFDADGEHEAGVAEHVRDVQHELGAESVSAEYKRADGTTGRMEMREDI